MLLLLDDIFEEDTRYPAYYVINFPGIDIGSELKQECVISTD